MASNALRAELKRLADRIAKMERPPDVQVIPSANGIDRILFQARFLCRALKQDPVGYAALIDAVRVSLLHNLKSRPELAELSEVQSVIESQG